MTARHTTGVAHDARPVRDAPGERQTRGDRIGRSRDRGDPIDDCDELVIRRGAKALVSTGARVLLVRERHADGTPFWTLPGGGVADGESVPATLRRELDEELDCACVVGEPRSAFWYVHSSLAGTVTGYAVRACSLLTDPTPVAAEGVVGLRWCRPDDLPTTTLPQVRAVVKREIEGSRPR